MHTSLACYFGLMDSPVMRMLRSLSLGLGELHSGLAYTGTFANPEKIFAPVSELATIATLRCQAKSTSASSTQRSASR
jgi:hypothetical protein